MTARLQPLDKRSMKRRHLSLVPLVGVVLACATMLDPRIEHVEAAGKPLAAALEHYRANRGAYPVALRELGSTDLEAGGPDTAQMRMVAVTVDSETAALARATKAAGRVPPRSELYPTPGRWTYDRLWLTEFVLRFREGGYPQHARGDLDCSFSAGGNGTCTVNGPLGVKAVGWGPRAQRGMRQALEAAGLVMWPVIVLAVVAARGPRDRTRRPLVPVVLNCMAILGVLLAPWFNHGEALVLACAAAVAIWPAWIAANPRSTVSAFALAVRVLVTGAAVGYVAVNVLTLLCIAPSVCI